MGKINGETNMGKIIMKNRLGWVVCGLLVVTMTAMAEGTKPKEEHRTRHRGFGPDGPKSRGRVRPGRGGYAGR